MKKDKPQTDKKTVTVKVTKNGPYIVSDQLPIVEKFMMPNEQGEIVEYRVGQSYKSQMKTALCRCGHTKNKPYCDGAHVQISFKGDSTAPHEPIINNTTQYEGPNFTLVDNEMYCAFARFCDAFGQVWNLVKKGDKYSDLMTLKEVKLCPSGRLMIIDNQTGELIEEEDAPAIDVLEDPMIGISGPLALKGNVIVEDENGQTYENRNRQTLCRCGKSSNKPFCDGGHAAPKNEEEEDSQEDSQSV